MNTDDTLVIIACRSGDEPLTPGNKVGYHCEAESCGKRIQVSPRGLAQKAMHKHARLLCNMCAIKYAEMAKAVGKFEGIKQNENAAAYMKNPKSADNPIANWVRRNK